MDSGIDDQCAQLANTESLDVSENQGSGLSETRLRESRLCERTAAPGEARLVPAGHRRERGAAIG